MDFIDETWKIKTKFKIDSLTMRVEDVRMLNVPIKIKFFYVLDEKGWLADLDDCSKFQKII